MSQIDDIFARLGGRRITATDHRDQRDIPRRGKAGGSRMVEVVHLPTGRGGTGAARRTDTGVRAQTWDGGFATRSAPPSPPLAQPQTAKAPEQVGHVVARWERVAEPAPISPPAPDPIEIEAAPVEQPKACSSTSEKARPVADPFDPDDDRANCLRCGYVVEPGRERRGLMTCAECAG